MNQNCAPSPVNKKRLWILFTIGLCGLPLAVLFQNSLSFLTRSVLSGAIYAALGVSMLNFLPQKYSIFLRGMITVIFAMMYVFLITILLG